jgi:hypothetical protein
VHEPGDPAVSRLEADSGKKSKSCRVMVQGVCSLGGEPFGEELPFAVLEAFGYTHRTGALGGLG